MAAPPLTPVTTPVALTVATAVLLLLQAPPVAVSLRVVVAPAQMVAVAGLTIPGAASGFTVTGRVASDEPQELVRI